QPRAHAHRHRHGDGGREGLPEPGRQVRQRRRHLGVRGRRKRGEWGQRVEATWRDFAGHTGVGHAVALSSDTGYFWFTSAANVEVVTKALDARGVNGQYWFFYGALSNVEYTITVTDVATARRKTYTNPMNKFGSLGDTSALPAS